MPPFHARHIAELLWCDRCNVGWSPDAGQACWVCRAVVGAATRSVYISSQYSGGHACSDLELEALKEPRDWDADPCAYRAYPLSLP